MRGREGQLVLWGARRGDRQYASLDDRRVYFAELRMAVAMRGLREFAEAGRRIGVAIGAAFREAMEWQR